MTCGNCGGPLSLEGTCYRNSAACLPKVRTKMGGKGTGRGNLNLVSAGKAAKKMCPGCFEKRCWPNLCDLGPPRRDGRKGPCDCHVKMAASAPRLSVPLQVRNFGGVYSGQPHAHG